MHAGLLGTTRLSAATALAQSALTKTPVSVFCRTVGLLLTGNSVTHLLCTSNHPSRLDTDTCSGCNCYFGRHRNNQAPAHIHLQQQRTARQPSRHLIAGLGCTVQAAQASSSCNEHNLAAGTGTTEFSAAQPAAVTHR